MNDGSITVSVRQPGQNGASPTVTSEIVLVGSSTKIVKTAETDIKATDLKANDQIQIVGTTDASGAVSASAILYVALFASLAAYALWNAGVAAIGASHAGVFLHLMPAFGSVLAAVLLGESFRAFHAAGIALILAGVTLAGALRPARARS